MTRIFTPKFLGEARNFRVSILVIIILAIGLAPQMSFGQTPTAGDYRSRVSTGDWSTVSSWQVRDAGGNWTTATVAPGASNNVYIQGGHTITLTAGANCNSLHLKYDGSTRGKLILNANVLNINGKLRSYSGNLVTSASDGTFYSSQVGASTIPEDLITSTSGKIKFVGNTRDLTDAGAWGTYGTDFAVEFALNPGQTGTFNTGFKSKDILISSGIVNTQLNRIGPDAGTDNSGNLTINSGAMLITGDVIYKSGTKRSNTLTLNAGSRLKFTNAAPGVAFASVSISPTSTIIYGADLDNQYFLNFPYSGMVITSYGHVVLEGTGPSGKSQKWINRSGIIINGNLDINANAQLYNSGFPFSLLGNWTSYGPGAYAYSTGSDTIRFAGAGTQQINATGGISFKYVAKTGSGTVTQAGNVGFPTINGYLGIENGIWDAGIYTLIGAVPSSTLALNNNTELILGNVGGPSLPNFAGTITFNTNSTLTLNGNGAQILKGGLDYKNLNFDNSTYTTLASNPASIVGTVSVKSTATLDIGNSNGFGNGSTNLTMTGSSRFRMSGSTSSKPDIDGTYSLTGGVVEFYGSNVTRQNIKGKTAAGVTPINYYNIEVKGSNVGIGLYNIVITSNPLCSFTVKSGATYTMSDQTITGTVSPTSTCKVNVEAGALFNCGNDKGFHGFLQMGLSSSSLNSNIAAGSVTLSPGSTVSYIKDGDQTITNTVEYQHLIIAGNTGIKTAPSALPLVVDGDFTKTGNSVFAHNNGVVEMKNSSAFQNYYCTSAVPPTFYTLYNRNDGSGYGLNIQGDLIIQNKLQFKSNAKLYLYAGNITMKSTAAQTANIGQVLGGASVIDYPGAGRFIIERYLDLGPSGSHGKSWQFLAVPVNGGQTVNEAWQEGNAPMVAGNAGLGTLISSNVAGTGFDIIGGVGPSMKTYVAATNTWKGITRTDTTLYNAKGYMLFVRGDRYVSVYNLPATTTTLRTKGKIFTIGAVPNTPPVTNVAAGLFESVGNPYASAIDFDKLSRSNVQAVFYVWDPKLGTGYGLGAYQTFTETAPGSHLYAVTPGFGSYGMPGSINNKIESGQAFFVHSSGPAGTLSFSESAKVDGSQNVYRVGNFNGDISTMNIQLMSLAGAETLADGAKIQFKPGFSNAIDALDALKIMNGGENLGVAVQENKLAVERRANPVAGDTLWLNLTNLHAQDYRLDFMANPIHFGALKAFLVDRFLNESRQITETDTLKYVFNVNAAHGGSYAADRFCIVFKAAKRPFSIQNLSTHIQDGITGLSWHPVNAPEQTTYHIQGSTDGLHYTDINAPAIETNGAWKADLGELPASVTYYRVVGKSKNDIARSEILKLRLPGTLSVFPNPIVGNFAQISLKGIASGKYILEIADPSGNVLYSAPYSLHREECQINLPMGMLNNGVYFVRLKGMDNLYTSKLVLLR